MLLTVVLVLSRHQAWIRPALQSLLSQADAGATPDDLEVVLVDDASPDHAVSIVMEEAGSDPRVRLHRLPDRVDLPEARGIGIGLATGRHVWLLDPVDELLDGGLAAVLAALADDPDLVLAPSVVRDLYAVDRDPSGPAPRPLLREQVVRRTLLVEEMATPGAAVEVALATATVAQASSVSRLPQPAVAHRELPAAVRRQWAAEEPAAAVAAFDRAFALLADSPARDTALLRDARRSLGAALAAAPRDLLELVPAVQRPGLFRELGRVAAAHRESLPGPRGRREQARRTALLQGRHDVWSAVGKAPSAGPRSALRAARKLPRTRKALRDRARRLEYAAQRRRPLLPDVAVYTAYWGSAYSCNPRAIYEKARELVPHVRGVWVVTKGNEGVLPDGVPYVVQGTREYYRLMARATWFVNNANFANDVVKRPGQVHLQTHHGTPAKKMGLDLVHAKHSSMGLNFRRLMNRVRRWDYSVSANEFTTEIWERVYPSGTYTSLETGYPRNDVLATATAEHRERVRAELGIAPDQTAVLYTPTHREYTAEYVALLDVDALAEALGPDHVLLMRTHYFYADAGRAAASERVRDVASYPSIEDLSIASDVLVTDYSSLMFDYAVLDRPIVLYLPDWEEYRTQRGVYVDLVGEPPGPVAQTQDELTKVLTSRAQDTAESAALRTAFRARFCALEDGRAAERVVRAVWPDPR